MNFVPITDGVAVTVLTPVALGTPGATDVQVDNRGTVDAYIKFGDVAVTVTVASGLRIPAGAIMVYSRSRSGAYIVAAVASGSPNLVVHSGVGD